MSKNNNIPSFLGGSSRGYDYGESSNKRSTNKNRSNAGWFEYKEQLDNLEEDYIETIDKVAGVIAQYGIALNKEGTTNQGSIQNTIETMVGNYPEDVKITILEKALAKLIANI